MVLGAGLTEISTRALQQSLLKTSLTAALSAIRNKMLAHSFDEMCIYVARFQDWKKIRQSAYPQRRGIAFAENAAKRV